MRECPTDAQYLNYRFRVSEKPFWDSCKDGLEQMFAPRLQDLDRIGPHLYEWKDGTTEREVLSPVKSGSKEEVGWRWYVRERHTYSSERRGTFPDSYFENQMYEWLRDAPNSLTKPILLIHGRTGCGKTTFVRYFFAQYLPRVDAELASSSYVLRQSFPVVANTLARAEDEFDHSVYRYLIETFKVGKSNLGDPENLVEMARLEYPDDTNAQEYTVIKNPPTGYSEQLRWIREIVVARQTQEKDKPVSDFADFNRLAIKYLCTIDPKRRFVFFLDNIDHLPAPLQVNAWLLARHKLAWVNSMHSTSFVITIRSYLLKNSRKESALRAYGGKIQEIGLAPPSLYDILVARKEASFDGYYPKRSGGRSAPDQTLKCSLRYKGISVPLYCPNELLSTVLLSFRETDKDKYIAQLCNYDIRQGLEVARAVLEYPFYNWQELASLVYQQWAKSKGDQTELLTYERILDAIIRRHNLICEPVLPFFDNLFMVDSSDHYSNTLCKYFILKMMDKRTHMLVEAQSVLKDLGHPEAIVETALQELLDCNIITSPQGTNITKHKVRSVSSEDTTLCSQYLHTISPALYYLQAMAYITPLRKQYAERVPLPTCIEEDDRSFVNRVNAAHALVQQIHADYDEQVGYVRGLPSDAQNKCNGYIAEYGFGDMVSDLRRGAHDALQNIKGSRAFPSVDWNSLLDQWK